MQRSRRMEEKKWRIHTGNTAGWKKELKEADKDEAERAKEISFLEFEIDED